MAHPAPARIVALLCLAEALSMAGFAAYPAFLPTLRADWGMSASAAGLVGGAFFFGYMLAVPLLAGLTDRIDARVVFAGSCGIAALGLTAFGLFAQGVVSGAACQALAGAGLAGSYMPGLKALTDRVEDPRLPRFIAFYTSTFGIGTSLSLLGAGWLGGVLSWQTTFILLAGGPALAGVTVLLGLAPQGRSDAHHAPWWPCFGPVLADRATRNYIVGYAVHCWELFGLRSWLVAFIAFAYGMSQSAAALAPTEAAALINLLGLPASILGNEAAGRLGRTRWVAGTMAVAGVLCWLAGAAAGLHWGILIAVLAVYFVAVMADSAALTAGLVAVTPPARRGAAMALYSLLGFGAGFLAPLVFGITLDLAGGSERHQAWLLAFGTLGSGGLLWSLYLRRRAAAERAT